MPDFLSFLSGAMLFLALAGTAGVLLLELLLCCRRRKDAEAEAVDIEAALRDAPYHRIRDVLPEGFPRRADAAQKPEAE